jgi:surfactin synthase thioesterase subunit
MVLDRALRCPPHVFGGLDDAVTPPAQLEHRRRCAAREFSCAAREFSVAMFAGGHACPLTEAASVLSALGSLRPGLRELGRQRVQ